MRSSIIRWKLDEAIGVSDAENGRKARRILANRRTRDAAIETIVLRLFRDEVGPIGELSFWELVLEIVRLIQENDASTLKWLIENGIPLLIDLFSEG